MSEHNVISGRPLGQAILMAAVIAMAVGSLACADVLNMGGTRNADGSWNGLASLEMVTVGNPSNAPDTRYGMAGYGSVAYAYQIGKFEVTAAQYCEFLNAVAKTDTYGLYNPGMWNDWYSACAIQRNGGAGNYTYSVAADWANRPVTHVSFWDAARFANWLHNGQPTGAQGPGTTEDGAYVNIGDQNTFARQTNAKWWIPSEDEWYKASYHKNDGVTGNYWDYPTASDGGPWPCLENPDPGNNANYCSTVDFYWTLGAPYFKTEVGEFENSDSPYGTFDQAGNVWEWNETMIGLSRGVRGGYWDDDSYYISVTYRGALVPTNESYGVGFRIASVAAAVPGDATGDGRVDADDAEVLATNWGQAGGRAQGDFNNDGVINALDASILAANWGYNAATEQGGPSTAVPEPGGVALLLTLLTVGIGFVSRRHA